MDAAHSTGVDRVDLHYALWMRARASVWRGVVQRSTGFVFLENTFIDALLGSLRVRWFDAGVDELQSRRVAELQSSRVAEWAILLEKFRRVGFLELCSERGLFAALASRLLAWPFKKPAVFPVGDWQGWTYVNVGHCFRFESAMKAMPLDMKRIYFLHDVIPLTHPETQKATSRAHFRKFCEYVGHSNSDIIVSSQATVDAIATLPGGERKLLNSVASMQVCPLAVEERFAKRSDRVAKLQSCKVAGAKTLRKGVLEGGDGAMGYFLSVGTVEPRKNLELLVRVWERLVESGNAIPMLIWVGKFGWSCDKQLMRRFERLQQQGFAELLSGVSDPELLELMAGAIALLFPSKIEGWGLPLSEALALRVPVIASRIAVFEEVGQGVPELLELDDLDAWKSMILNYAATDSRLRTEQIRRMRRYQPLTWTQHFDQLETLWGALRP
jgi:glycosyltransferase involved in cell wall biosynthesis